MTWRVWRRNDVPIMVFHANDQWRNASNDTKRGNDSNDGVTNGIEPMTNINDINQWRVMMA